MNSYLIVSICCLVVSLAGFVLVAILMRRKKIPKCCALICWVSHGLLFVFSIIGILNFTGLPADQDMNKIADLFISLVGWFAFYLVSLAVIFGVIVYQEKWDKKHLPPARIPPQQP